MMHRLAAGMEAVVGTPGRARDGHGRRDAAPAFRHAQQGRRTSAGGAGPQRTGPRPRPAGTQAQPAWPTRDGSWSGTPPSGLLLDGLTIARSTRVPSGQVRRRPDRRAPLSAGHGSRRRGPPGRSGPSPLSLSRSRSSPGGPGTPAASSRPAAGHGHPSDGGRAAPPPPRRDGASAGGPSSGQDAPGD